jgi:hypothetical protein
VEYFSKNSIPVMCPEPLHSHYGNSTREYKSTYSLVEGHGLLLLGRKKEKVIPVPEHYHSGYVKICFSWKILQ